MSKKIIKPKRFDSLKKFLKEYRRSRLGVAGVVIILFFVILAVLAPFLTKDNPIYTQNLASPISVPIWARYFPQYQDYPVNSYLLSGSALQTSSDLGHWQLLSLPSTNNSAKGFVTFQTTSSGLLLNFSPAKSSSSNSIISIFQQSSANPSFVLNQTFTYPWTYPCEFTAGVTVTALKGNLSTSDFSVDIYIKNPAGKVFHILGPAVYADPSDAVEYVSQFVENHPTQVTADPKNQYVNLLATGSNVVTNMGRCGLSEGIFGNRGSYTVSYIFSSKVSTSVIISNPFVYIFGSAYGLLGTDEYGRDIWSQFVYGSRVSLEVGLAAAAIGVLIGTLVGLVSGYKGGYVDEALMRFNDFLLVLPFLPLLLVLITLLDISHVVTSLNNEALILILLAVLGWNGIARIIRSQVLSVKQRQFVEASTALGGNDKHIIWKHILPNVMGLVYANIAIQVPSIILTEAALTFLGFGDPSLISWGYMLSHAGDSLNAQNGFVWWWFLPPGLAIAILSMAFVFVGFSLDSVLNPKLRKR